MKPSVLSAFHFPLHHLHLLVPPRVLCFLLHFEIAQPQLRDHFLAIRSFPRPHSAAHSFWFVLLVTYCPCFHLTSWFSS